MFTRIIFALIVGYGVCVAVALVDQQYFQATMFFLVATLHILSRFEMERPEVIKNRGLLRAVQMAILCIGLAVLLYLAFRL
jgi:hypothetical protein